MKKSFKMILFISVILVSCLMITNVKAYILTAKDVEQDWIETGYIQNYRIVANGNMVELYNNDTLLGSFDMSQGYAILDTKEYGQEEFKALPFLIYKAAFDYVFLAKPFYNANLQATVENQTEEELERMYDEYGLYIKLSENNNNECGDIQYCIYSKVSFDLDKLDKFVINVLPVVEQDRLTDEQRTLLNNTPKIEIDDITKTSAKIYPNGSAVETDDKYNYCHVYRSDKIDGDYKKITSKKIKCNGEYGVVDDTLSENTTYYYKARFIYTNKMSDPVEIKTHGRTQSTNENETTSITTTSTEKKTNPKSPETGVSSHIITTMIVSSLSIVAIILLKKNKVISQL